MKYVHSFRLKTYSKNKTLILSIILSLIFVSFAGAFSVADAKKPTNKPTTIQSGLLKASDGSTITVGYDDWGYNYQARMFNGKYCDAYRDANWCQPYKDDNLMMKWNDAWLSNVDADYDGSLDRHYGYDSYIGSGAWLTNHMSGVYNEGWNVLGDYTLDYTFGGNVYSHDISILSFDEMSGEFEGIGAYPAGGPYTIFETVTGNVSGDDVTMRVEYNHNNYYVDVVGVVASDGTMSGTWANASQSGDWESVAGVATPVEQTWNYFVKIVAVDEDAVPNDGVWYTQDGVEIGPVIWGEFAVIQEVSNDTGTGDHGLVYKSALRSGLGNW